MERKDWIYIIVIISIMQACVWFFSYHYSGKGQILDYISFSGTLISIILAVLAIGYTYGESILQRNSSDALTDQIRSLKKIKDKIQLQADALDDIKILKKELNIFAQKVDQNFNATQQKFENFKNEFQNHPTLTTSDEKDLISEEHKEKLTELIFKNPSLFNKLVFLVLLSYVDTGRERVTLHIREYIQNIDVEIEDTAVLQSFFGAFVQLSDVLENFGLLVYEDEVDINKHLIKIFNEYIDGADEKMIQSFDNLGGKIIKLAKNSSLYES